MLNIECFEVGVLATNCYIITDEESGLSAVIDPGDYSPSLEAKIKSLEENTVKYVMLTHGHYDHIGYVVPAAKITGAEIVIGKEEEKFLSDGTLNRSFIHNIDIKPIKADLLVDENDKIMLGKTEITVLKLPGHTGGSVGYLADGKLFCGDTLFKGSMGRTDFETGSEQEIMRSLKKLSALPDSTAVYSGHGQSTAIGEEKRRNPYMQFAMKRY